MRTRRAIVAVLATALVACASPTPTALAPDTRNDTCASCRMPVSDLRFAAQLQAPGEEVRFFDDVGCLREFLAKSGGLSPAASVFVSDHRTRAWAPARGAAFARRAGMQTPMGSGLLAWADAASRAADPAAAGAASLSAAEVLGREKP